MGEQFAWFFDVIIIGILLICMYNGSKRGFIKSIVSILSLVIACVGAYAISKAVSPPIYDALLQEKIETIFVENIDNINIKSAIKSAIKKQNIDIEISDEQLDSIINSGGDLALNLQNFVKDTGTQLSSSQLKEKTEGVFSTETVLNSIKGKIPENVYKEIQNFIDKSKTSLTQTITALNNPNREEGATQLEVIIRPLAISVVQIILFFVFFAILMAILQIVAGIVTKTISFVPFVGTLNSFLGLVLGLLQGAIIILLITFVLKGIIALTDNELIMFNTATIDKTYILDKLYNLKIFK